VQPDQLPDTLLRMTGLVAAYLAVFGLAELVRARTAVDADATRAVVHVSSGILALALPVLFTSAWPIIALAVGFVALMAVTRRLALLTAIHGVQRRTVGAYLYPVGIAVAFLASGGSWPAYPIAVLTLAFADAAGGVVGQRYGSHAFRQLSTVRTLEGSVAVFVMAVLVTTLVLVSRDPLIAPAIAMGIIVGAVVVTAEAVSPWGLDNLTIPAVVVTFLAWIGEPWTP